MIIDCAVYENGVRRPGKLPLDDAYEAGRQPGAFVWIGLHEPTEDEFESVRKEFGLHELAVEDAIKAHQRAKLEVYGESVFVVLKPAFYFEDTQELELGEVMLFIGDGFVVSVRHGAIRQLGEVRHRLEADPELLRYGTGAVLHAVLDRVVDDYAPVVDALDSDIQEVEAVLFSPAGTNPAEGIYKLMREVLEFLRGIAPLVEPLDRLAHGKIPFVDEDLTPYFRDVYDHLLRAVDQVNAFRDLLASILDANLTQVSVRQNADMRKISAWVAIAAVPTMVAGIYGMNFEHMPELRWTYGYPLVLIVIAIACVGLYRAFRRNGWL